MDSRGAKKMNQKLNEVIREIFDRFGKDILLEGERFCSILADMIPERQLEIKVLRRMNQESILIEVHKAVINEDSCDFRIIKKVERLLIESGFSEEWKKVALDAFEMVLVENAEETKIQNDIGVLDTNCELNSIQETLFSQFVHTKRAKRILAKALEKISLSAYTGNVMVTGEVSSDTIKLAKNIMKYIQLTNTDFSGVIAKVRGSSLNSKEIESTIAKLNNGGLIIENASEMNNQAVMRLVKALDTEKTGIVVILEDTKKAMKRMLATYPSINTFFNVHIMDEEWDSNTMVSYGEQYAFSQGYLIDDLGALMLLEQIEKRQMKEHVVTVEEVRKIVENAIAKANRKSIGNLFNTVLRKRYNDDMIILKEKDFL